MGTLALPEFEASLSYTVSARTGSKATERKKKLVTSKFSSRIKKGSVCEELNPGAEGKPHCAGWVGRMGLLSREGLQHPLLGPQRKNWLGAKIPRMLPKYRKVIFFSSFLFNETRCTSV